ncbi:ThuA domain-containing protein [Fulvivirgaceae bacterium BMA12]|uniref:ThuA domain-containing protein n=1 Tax=Agaribacillus aureus TaxID=3051825 RepID=A0ABT8LEV7_9BACT|nr:ThuA domain-containing protein [Fulvivirgaceae bacterium BMA12]
MHSIKLFLPVIFSIGIIVASCTSKDPGKRILRAAVDADELPSLKDKKVLMVYGGWPGHKPKEFTEKISELLKKEGAIVTVSDSVDVYADKSIMSSVDLIIQSITMDKINKEQIEGLVKAVKGGVGFAGTHGGFCDAFRENTTYQYMTGGQFVAHPGGQIKYTVNILDKNDLITRGFDDFDTKTEQYYMHVDPNVKVLATTTFDGKHDDWIEGAIMPVIWKKYFAKGRIFYLALGHNPEEFDQPEVQKLLMNGLKWASGSKYLPKEDWLNPVYQD